MKLIKRDYYLNKLLSVKDVPDIKSNKRGKKIDYG